MKRVQFEIILLMILATILTLTSCDFINQQLEKDRIEEENRRHQEEQERLRLERQKEDLKKALTVSNITQVLKSDHEISSYNTNKDPEYQANAMRNINLKGCPSDFSVSYIDHIHAWEEYAEVYKVWQAWNSEENINNILVQAFVDELLGTTTVTYEDLVKIENEIIVKLEEAREKIRTTYYTVERIAVKYGATLP
jgi:hypothetical protein